MSEQALTLATEKGWQAAILHPALQAERQSELHTERQTELACDTTGLLIVVGGPQYRVGSHRQFVQLARATAQAGIPTLRFDVTGMGDSAGMKHSFDNLQTDIAVAIDGFFAAQPQLQKVVLWGLCDGASAALIYAHQDPRVSALVLVNPWLEDDGAKAKATLFEYYFNRLFSKGFWSKLVQGDLQVGKSLTGFFDTLKSAFFSKQTAEKTAVTDNLMAHAVTPQTHYQARMAQGYRNFTGAVQIILSGNDLTAKEFELQFKDKKWRQKTASQTLVIAKHPEADHTFSTSGWKRWCEAKTIEFMRTFNT